MLALTIRKMNVKTIRQHFSPLKLYKNKILSNTRHQKGCGKIKTFISGLLGPILVEPLWRINWGNVVHGKHAQLTSKQFHFFSLTLGERLLQMYKEH